MFLQKDRIAIGQMLPKKRNLLGAELLNLERYTMSAELIVPMFLVHSLDLVIRMICLAWAIGRLEILAKCLRPGLIKI